MAEASVLPFVAIVEYGVLGTQLTAEGAVSQVAEEPSGDMAIVDPAGLPFIQKHGPAAAGGASGAIYKWIGIKSDPAFPEPVRAAIKAAGQAKFHQYGERLIIHAVGPNLNGVYGVGAEVVEKAIGLLARAYANSLSQFVISGAAKLRILPISGGIFAGRFADDIPWMTFAALEKAFVTVSDATRDELTRRFSENKLELCIFAAEAVEEFTLALAAGGAPPEGGAQVLNTLWAGALAEVSGLESEKAQVFNGTVCTVLNPQSKDGKYMVEMNNGVKASLPSDNIALAAGGGLVPGATAKIDGLTGAAAVKFNGTLATLQSWDKKNSKWVVVLKETGKSSRIPAINLRTFDSIDLSSDEWIDLF